LFDSGVKIPQHRNVEASGTMKLSPDENKVMLKGNGGKKKYQVPRILYKEPLEAIAAVCEGPPGKEDTLSGCTSAFSS
jgi:hypothetical protein